MTWAARFENVSKVYRRNRPRHMSLRDSVAKIARRIAAPTRGGMPVMTPAPALDDVTFDIHEGETLALIGPNGAGKTTVLKMLARVSPPTRGHVRLRGRVGGIIDIDTGIHPELTGRENIWLYGRILGMSRQHISRRFDQIVEFAELAHALDHPVKTYSTGMQLRLGFAIASHADPDIFIVDEALAVGDAGFQAKCVDRMTRLVGDGRTLLFVSHNLTAIESLCSRGVFLLDGKIAAFGGCREVVRNYLDWTDARRAAQLAPLSPPHVLDRARIENVSLHGAGGRTQTRFRTGDDVEIRLKFSTPESVPRLLSLGISDGRPGMIIVCSLRGDANAKEVLEHGPTVSCKIHKIPLLPRVYHLWCSLDGDRAHRNVLGWQQIGTLRISQGPLALEGVAARWQAMCEAVVHADYEWVTSGREGAI